MKDYLAGQAEYRYPHIGEPTPPGGAKVLLLTEGGVCVVGSWGPHMLAWAPLPKSNKDKERRSQTRLPQQTK